MQTENVDVTCAVTGSIMTVKKSVPCAVRKGRFMKKMEKVPAKFPNVAKLMREARISKGFSQTFVANQLDYENGQFISNVERGLCSFPDRKIKEVCALLELDAEAVVNAMVEDHRLNIKRHL